MVRRRSGRQCRIKRIAHKEFDSLWRKGKMSRGHAYRWLASALDIAPSKTHFSMLSTKNCIKAITKIKDFKLKESIQYEYN